MNEDGRLSGLAQFLRTRRERLGPAEAGLEMECRTFSGADAPGFYGGAAFGLGALTLGTVFDSPDR